METIIEVIKLKQQWATQVNKPYHKLIHNNLNHSFSKILDELGLEYSVEYGVGQYFFDFYITKYNLLIEVDGGGHMYHRDKQKEKAILAPLRLLRIKVRDRVTLKRDYERIKNKISKECGF